MHNSEQLLFALLENLEPEWNAHLQGAKSVFIRNDDTRSSLTQFAYGVMQKGDSSGLHIHKTMDEYFYFISGKGLFSIESEIFQILPASFIRVPAGSVHNLSNEDEEMLKFVYFGIAV